MNEHLKSKYYGLIKNKDFKKYEQVGKVLASLEDRIIKTGNKVPKEDLIKLLDPLKDTEKEVYEAIVSDINNGLI